MLNIGYHESTANGLEGLGLEALEVGANTFAFFTRNPRGGKAKDIILRSDATESAEEITDDTTVTKL